VDWARRFGLAQTESVRGNSEDRKEDRSEGFASIFAPIFATPSPEGEGQDEAKYLPR
jgi:hypothetical protein